MAVIIQTLASLSSASATDASTFEASISALKSSISALESSIDSLDGASGFWEKVGWYCAIVVGLGVIAEIFTIVREYFEDRRAWRRGIVRPPDRPSFGWMLFDVFATIVVVAGIFGEAGATGKVSSINSLLRSRTSELRAKSDQLLALVTLEAGNAATSAKTAHDEAEAVKTEAGALKTELSALELRAEQLQDRVLIDRHGMGNRLHPFWTRNIPRMKYMSVRLEYLKTGCTDCEQLGDQFKRALHDGANWIVSDPIPNRNREQFIGGVSVHITCEAGTPDESKWRSDAAKALVEELNKKQHIKASTGKDECFDETKKNELLVRIGWKPTR
jgi:hypothetical protein